MSDNAIRVENLSKLYHIGAQQQRHDTLRDTLAASFRRNGKDHSTEELWALKDISFEIQRGAVVGVIGRNGAGKSTLLKILSRITEPTSGRAWIHGRVGSLLEVGTGFHPELTGRENIYLNGAILGMRRTEIAARFDEIVAFAETEKFLDTPVKRYSSGMYVRLAFAVAAHLEPEILLVDEVLAVGDAEFQKKCLGKMGEVSTEGRTVLFVSHNMAAIQALCACSIQMADGRIEFYGDSETAVRRYLGQLARSPGKISISQGKDRAGSGRIRIADFYITDDEGVRQEALRPGKDYRLVVEYDNPRGLELEDCVGSFGIKDGLGQHLLLMRSSFSGQNFVLNKPRGQLVCRVSDLNLTPGTYGVELFLSYGEFEVLDWLPHATDIQVEDGDFFGTGSQGLGTHCKILTRSDWSAS